MFIWNHGLCNQPESRPRPSRPRAILPTGPMGVAPTIAYILLAGSEKIRDNQRPRTADRMTHNDNRESARLLVMSPRLDALADAAGGLAGPRPLPADHEL